MAKVYNIGGIACLVEYHKEYDETFLHPAQDEKWADGVFAYISDIAESNGRNVVGGHDYYMAIAGNVLETV